MECFRRTSRLAIRFDEFDAAQLSQLFQQFEGNARTALDAGLVWHHCKLNFAVVGDSLYIRNHPTDRCSLSSNLEMNDAVLAVHAQGRVAECPLVYFRQ